MLMKCICGHTTEESCNSSASRARNTKLLCSSTECLLASQGTSFIRIQIYFLQRFEIASGSGPERIGTTLVNESPFSSGSPPLDVCDKQDMRLRLGFGPHRGTRKSTVIALKRYRRDRPHIPPGHPDLALRYCLLVCFDKRIRYGSVRVCMSS